MSCVAMEYQLGIWRILKDLGWVLASWLRFGYFPGNPLIEVEGLTKIQMLEVLLRALEDVEVPDLGLAS